MAALVASLASMGLAAAEDAQKAKPAPDKSAESEIARYCGAIGPSAAEARLNYQYKKLAALEARVKEEAAALVEREAEARDWVTKREEMMKAATDEVVAIYAKMPAEAAATQIADMDETVATSILVKLKPQVAGKILNEMENDKAARLTTLMSGGSPEDKKS
jgi:flagellar motility protein MotE (MotC chaperone)